MKKILLGMVLLLTVCATFVLLCDKSNSKENNIPENIDNLKNNKEKYTDLELLPTMSSKSNAKNQVWVGTFQLVWNDLIDNIIHNPVEFVGEKTKIADNLNKKEFTTKDISDVSYYKKWGLVSPKLKQEIEKGIKKKFGEKSDILNNLDWTPEPEKYILYAMLKKDFEYIEKLNKLPNDVFQGSEGKVKYFGVDRDSVSKQKKSVQVLFYNGKNDYAIALKSKQGDIVSFYRTDDDKTLDKYYSDMLRKTNSYNDKKYLGIRDEFKAPMLDFKTERKFDELCNKPIKNSNFIISDALQTLQLKMDEEGVKLKSEAAIVGRKTGVMRSPRYYYFDNKYVLFLSENNKKPYFAMKVTDAKKLQK